MDGINQLDLITQRVLSLQVKNLTEELAAAQAEIEQKNRRITELEAPPTETTPSE